MIRMKLQIFSSLLALGLCTHAAAAPAPQPDSKAMGAALTRYLAENGQLCVGKYDWPITVTPREVENGHRNALQLPAIVQAGLATATPGDDGAVIYRLSGTGEQYYWPRTLGARSGEPAKAVHDFCAGKLKLDKVVRWSAPVLAGDHYEAAATYTYSIAAAPWMADPRLQQAFPMIARVIKGQHGAELVQRMRYTGVRWEAITSIE